MNILIYQYYHYKEGTENAIKSNSNYHELSCKSISAYAKKFGCDYKFYRHEISLSPFYGIFVPFQNKECFDYDAVCFIDSDILSTTHNNNLLDYLTKDRISAHVMSGPKSVHANSGVVVFPRSVYEDFSKHIEDLENKHNNRSDLYGNYDQKILNEYILPTRHQHIPCKFNWKLHNQYYPPTERFEQQFIHYVRNNKKMLETDYKDKRILK
jgi:hypothetical protein